MRKRFVFATTISAALALAAGSALGEEAYKKYRFSLSINNYSSTDELRTNADNSATTTLASGFVVSVDDPRPDSAVKNANGIEDDVRYDFQASYGLLKWRWAELTLDSGVGLFK